MDTKIFVNLPVKDLRKTVEFFSKIGYKFDPRFSDENAKCLIISENIYAMLLVEPFFKSFTHKEIADTSKTSEVILTLSADSREEVDDLLKKVIDSGGSETEKPEGQENPEWMYGRGFQDPDGHLWEIFYMDAEQIPDQQSGVRSEHA
jgi:uncharacterized protein